MSQILLAFVAGLLIGGGIVYHFHTQIALAVSKAESTAKADLAIAQAKIATLEAKFSKSDVTAPPVAQTPPPPAPPAA